MKYCGYITKIKEIIPHPNADKLMIAKVFDSTVIIAKDENKYNLNDLFIYFPEGLQLDETYCKNNKLLRSEGGYIEDGKRNIKTIKLRGEYSDGLLMPLSSLSYLEDISTLKEGACYDKVSIKYIPRSNRKTTCSTSSRKDKRRKNDINTCPLFFEHADTAQLAYNLNNFKKGDIVEISLKLDGTSQRTGNIPVHKKRLFGLLPNKISYKLISGTRHTILRDDNNGFYQDNGFRKKWHDFFAARLPKNYEVYYELVGWVNDFTPIMPREGVIFDYGCEVGECEAYVYRITFLDRDEKVHEVPRWEMEKMCEQWGCKIVPSFGYFVVNSGEEVLDIAKKYYNGGDLLGKHIREGVVIRKINTPKFEAYKIKNNEYKVLAGISVDKMANMAVDESILEEM